MDVCVLLPQRVKDRRGWVRAFTPQAARTKNKGGQGHKIGGAIAHASRP